jgi:GT2 family glycosyltransferase
VFWHEADGALPQTGPILERYRELVTQWRPARIALPAPTDNDPDHRRLTRGLLDSLTRRWSGELLFYETTTPLGQVNHTESCALEAKLQALACHASQQAQYDYEAHARGLAAMRGAAIRQPAAEAFLSHHWNGSPQNFFDNQPLISVILRADDRDFLDAALASLCEQTYDHVEAIVVWHGDAAPPSIPATLQHKVLQGPGGRAENLNAGLAAATGQYVAFLDQDDVWEAEFLEVLLAELHADRALDIAFGDYRLATCRREGGRTIVLSYSEPEGQDHRPGLLLAGNRIPLNSFVCNAGLARRLGFDQALQAYEDWDFLARAELAGATFRRVPHWVSQYRLYPLEGEQADVLTLHRRKGYLAWHDEVRRKIVALLTPKASNDLLDLIGELDNQLADTRGQARAASQSLTETGSLLTAAQRDVESADRWAQLLVPDRPAGTAVSRLAAAAFGAGPCIALVLPVCDPEPTFLLEALESVYAQTYAHWQLCVADDASTHPEVHAVLTQFEQRAEQDPRLRLVRRAKRGGIVAASESAVALADAPWLGFLDHDDRLDPDALLEVAGAIARQPQVGAVYTDSRTVDRNGVLLRVQRKPPWSPETLLHINYINHLTVVRRDLYEAAGGLRAEAEGCQDWDLWLRLAQNRSLQVAHIARPLYDWRATETSVAYTSSAKPYALEADCRSVSTHLAQRGMERVSSAAAVDGEGLRHQWQAALKPLTVVIPTHNNPRDLERLLGVLASSDYPGLQVVLIANRVEDAATQALLARAAEHAGVTVRVDDRDFNWAALNNAAVRETDTPWLLFLNDDVDLVSPEALKRLGSYLALDPAIGAVGARLHYGPEEGGGIQHDGIETHPEWVARNINGDAEDDDDIGLPRNVSAVTGACLLTPRAAFDQCGGFEERLAVSFNDVDYGLALRRHGWRVVQASDVVCTHHESRTRGAPDSPAKIAQLRQEASLMREKWGSFLEERHRLRYERSLVGTRILHIPQ